MIQTMFKNKKINIYSLILEGGRGASDDREISLIFFYFFDEPFA